MTSESAAALGPDTMLGSYRLVKEIGRGGMATVWQAHHVVLPRRAAIKVMHGELRKQPGMATRVVQEASILEEIRHPGIARVFECNLLPDRRPWIAMELIEGETLANRLAERSSLPALEVARLLASVAEVLTAVHACGVVHRDLKPDNLILTPIDREYPLRVIDWGVARLGPLGGVTLDGLTPGTPIYMSPEQAAGRNIAAPCDIYSLGVIAYEALTGHPPFDGRTLAEVVCMHLMGAPAPLRDRCTAPYELRELVHRMLDKDPSLRPGAIEIRQVARAIVHELATAYDTFELSGIEPPRSHHEPLPVASVVDAEALEIGVTELMPVIRKPRWTPDIGFALVDGRDLRPAGSAAEGRRGSIEAKPLRTITPRAMNDQVAGEIEHTKRR